MKIIERQKKVQIVRDPFDIYYFQWQIPTGRFYEMFSLMSKKKGKTIIIKILLKKSEAGDLSKVVSEQEKKKKKGQ